MEEKDNEPNLQLNLTLSEVNLVIQALSKEPFKDVFQLIGNINSQAAMQLDEKDN